MQIVIATSKFVNRFDHPVDTLKRALSFLSPTICICAIDKYVNQRHCPVSPSFCWGAMAEAPKTERECVSADFVTLHGQTKRLRFARGVALGVLFFVYTQKQQEDRGD